MRYQYQWQTVYPKYNICKYDITIDIPRICTRRNIYIKVNLWRWPLTHELAELTKNWKDTALANVRSKFGNILHFELLCSYYFTERNQDGNAYKLANIPACWISTKRKSSISFKLEYTDLVLSGGTICRPALFSLFCFFCCQRRE